MTVASWNGINAFFRALALAALLSIAPGGASSQTAVEQLVVTGNQRIEPETIASYMTLRVGDPFDVDEIDNSLKKLFATGLFADVAIRREDTTLIVEVVENPIVNRIAFEGNRSIDTEQLEAEVRLRPRIVYTRTKAQNDVARILELYRRSGRFNATVELKAILKEQNRIDLVFEIDEGEATVVREINFIGNDEFSDSALRETIVSKETAWYRFLSSNDTYDPDRLAFDRELLRQLYFSEGFVDFRILSVVADLTPDRREFFITFTIEEGPRYKLGEVVVTSDLSGVSPEDVADMVMIETGDWYDAGEVEDVAENIALELGDRGEAFVDVRPRTDRDRDNRLIDLAYHIGRSDPLYVERIEIFGNLRTADEVVRREFRLSEGDAFSPAALRRSERRVRSLGFFRNVSISRSPGSQPDTTVIDVEVEERSTGELVIGAGFSTFDDLLFNISLGERNLLGKGQRLFLDLALSGKRQSVDLSFTEPYFLDRELSAGFDLFHRRLDLQDESAYDRQDSGGALRASYPLTENLSHTMRYTLQAASIEKIGLRAPLSVRRRGDGTSVTSAIGSRLDYDRRNDVVRPTEGYLLQQATDIAGFGGTERYIRNSIGASYFHPLDTDWIGNLRAEAAIIQGFLGEDIDILDRFFLGGASLRGFEPAGVGPRDLATGYALGGNIFWTGTAELSMPLGLPRELGVFGRVFTDWGSLFDLDESGPAIADEASPRGSVGVGLSYNSPIGPLRMDFSQDVVSEDFDRTELFRFSFGTAF